MSAAGIVSRVAAGVLGGWLFAWGFVALSNMLLLGAGQTYADARTLAYLLAFLVYLAGLCGAFVVRRAWQAWLALAGGGAAMTALAWWLARTGA
jgi:hypothetical protein